MVPIIYGEEVRERNKQVTLRLAPTDTCIALWAVNGAGDRVVTLILFEESISRAIPGAHHALIAAGYDASWAHWNIDGSIKLEGEFS